MNCMVVDIGSNTVKYDVFSLDGQVLSPVSRGARTVRLIDHITDGALSKDGLKKLCAVLANYKEEAARSNCARLEVFATASLRRTDEPEKTIRRIKKRTGLSVRLLSGEEEAECSFRGMLLTASPAPERGVMLDMGGGSTEINVFEKGVSLYSCSCPFGALSLKSAFSAGVFLAREKQEEISAYAESRVPGEARAFAGKCETAVLVGGTAKAAGKLIRLFLDPPPDQTVFPEEYLRALRARLETENGEIEELIRARLPERYDLMAAGLSGFAGVFGALGVREMTVCRGGIREGYLPFIDGRNDLVYRAKADG